MKIRLGYACITNCLDSTSSSPYTYGEYLKYGDMEKLDRVIVSNLKSLEEIIYYNIKNNIHFYRMSSKIIPLATKSDVKFDYINKYKSYYDKIGKMISDYDMGIEAALMLAAVLRAPASRITFRRASRQECLSSEISSHTSS